MKKFVALILASLFSILLPAGTALAQDDTATHNNDDKIKVYLSEPLGAGVDVYRVTACQKIQQAATLKCRNVDVDSNEYRNQCHGESKDGRPAPVLKNNPVFQCVNTNDTNDIDHTGEKCKSEDSNFVQAPVYGDMWVVAACPPDKECPRSIHGARENETDFLVKEYFVVPKGFVPDTSYRLHGDKPITETYSDLVDQDYVISAQPSFITGRCKSIELDARNYSRLSSSENEVTDSSFMCDFGSYIDATHENKCEKWGDSMVGTWTKTGACSFSCKRGERISAESGVDLITKFISAVYRWAASIVGIVAVLVMVYSGVEISMAGSHAEKIEAAKKRIFLSLAGLAILFLSGIILYTINPNFFV